MIISTVFGVAAFAAWLSALVHGLWSLAHLSGKTSLGPMLFRGISWFDAENFSPRGQQLQRRFVRSFAAFFVCILGLIMAVALTGSDRLR